MARHIDGEDGAEAALDGHGSAFPAGFAEAIENVVAVFLPSVKGKSLTLTDQIESAVIIGIVANPTSGHRCQFATAKPKSLVCKSPLTY